MPSIYDTDPGRDVKEDWFLGQTGDPHVRQTVGLLLNAFWSGSENIIGHLVKRY